MLCRVFRSGEGVNDDLNKNTTKYLIVRTLCAHPGSSLAHVTRFSFHALPLDWGGYLAELLEEEEEREVELHVARLGAPAQ